MKMLQVKFNAGPSGTGAHVSAAAADMNTLGTNNEPLPEIQRCLEPTDVNKWTAVKFSAEGFKTKSPTLQSMEYWTEEEKQKLEETLKNYAQNMEALYESDPFGYISRKTLDSSKTSDQVEAFIENKYKVILH